MDAVGSKASPRPRPRGSKQEGPEEARNTQQQGSRNGSGTQQQNQQPTAQKPEPPSGSYVPRPRVTFLIDKPARLSCEICYGTILMTGRLPTPDEARCFPHRAPALLPCGHLACHACLEKSLCPPSTPSLSSSLSDILGNDPNSSSGSSNSNSSSSRCPFCRFPLRYELCRHRVAARVLDSESVWTVPRTVPDGGTVPGQCGPCRARSDLEVARCTWRALARDYEATRERLGRRGGGGGGDDRHVRLLEAKYEQMERALAVALRGGYPEQDVTTAREAEW